MDIFFSVIMAVTVTARKDFYSIYIQYKMLVYRVNVHDENRKVINNYRSLNSMTEFPKGRVYTRFVHINNLIMHCFLL